MTALRMAVVGAGRMGRFHAEKIAALAAQTGEVALVAVADLHLDRAQAVALPLGARACRDAREAFADAQAAVVAAPTAVHAELAQAALCAGLDVLVEKPIAATLSEAEQIAATARARGRVLQVGHLEWFNAALRRILPLPAAPRFIEAQRIGPFPARGSDLDVVRDLMIHDLDILLRIAGEPVQVEAVGAAVVSEKLDIANARLRFAEGCVANVTASRISEAPQRRLRFFTPAGYFSADLIAQSVHSAHLAPPHESAAAAAANEAIAVDAAAAPNAAGAEASAAAAANAAAVRRMERRRLDVARADSLEMQLRAFLAAVRERRVRAGDAEQGLAALRTALRVLSAISAGAAAGEAR
ncbi:MAG: Gfo/Idh/MocA family oxidoreductase [Deltaproteobacteria bacterium]|nr:Gfo/Idh/MocA family oxidoreductase [Deltaproteobacteria bacterium]